MRFDQSHKIDESNPWYMYTIVYMWIPKGLTQSVSYRISSMINQGKNLQLKLDVSASNGRSKTFFEIAVPAI